MSLIIIYTLTIILFLYALQTLILIYASNRLHYSRSHTTPTVSIIVAARNEEHNIRNCLNSLAQLDYPRDKLEIILVNDRSEDNTGAIIAQFTERYHHFKSLTIIHPSAHLSGKASAISKGIEHSCGEIIFITDADCIVPAGWVKETVSYFTDEVGLVAGFTLLDQAGDSTSLFGKIQSLDWAYLLSVAAGVVALGIPLSCVGNNFAFRREAYDEVGGYEKVGFSVTEDFALLQAISQNTNWKIRFPILRNAVVLSKPQPTFRDFYQQRKRWAVGGKSVRPFGKFLMALGGLAHGLIPLSVIFFATADLSTMVGLRHSIYVPLLALLWVASWDLLLLSRTTRLLGRKDLLKYIPLFKIFHLFYLILLSLVIPFNGKINWKGITYTADQILTTDDQLDKTTAITEVEIPEQVV